MTDPSPEALACAKQISARVWEKYVSDETNEAISRIIDEAMEPLRNLLEMVLIFHSGGEWTEEKQHRWFNIMHTMEATTKVLCDGIRVVLQKGSDQ